MIVHVAGAVRRPGVYRLRTARASTTRSPRRRRDPAGRPRRAEPRREGRGRPPGRWCPSARRGAGAPHRRGAAAAPAAPGQPVNLNTATLEQLDTLTAIGPTTAQKILDSREERGGFGSVEELGEIPGIGEKRLASLREEVTL